MTAFHEVQFPPDISYGASGGPTYATSVVTTVSGFEKRNANWSQARVATVRGTATPSRSKAK